MKLLTKELEARLPPLYSTEAVPAGEKVAVAKFFFPAGRATWYVVESGRDPETVPRAVDLDGHEDVLFFGFVVSPLGKDCDEWGYFTLRELESVEVRHLHVERDLYFRPTKMSDLEVL